MDIRVTSPGIDTGQSSVSPSESTSTETKLVADINSQVKNLQQLWDSYYNPSAGEKRSSSAILAQSIRSNVSQLEELLKQLPSVNPDIAVLKDYAYACRLSLEDIAIEPDHSLRSRMLHGIERDFELRNVPGDGNCGIHAVLTTVNPEMNTREVVHLVRGDMVQRMRSAFHDEIDNQWEAVLRNETQYLPTLGEHHGSKATARRLADAYCERIARDGAWIGERELPFLSQVIGKSIEVYNPQLLRGKEKLENGVVRHGQFKESVAIFHDASHYQALLPRNSQ
jgi:hypothetical protein